MILQNVYRLEKDHDVPIQPEDYIPPGEFLPCLYLAKSLIYQGEKISTVAKQ
jgi:hypothetical protein